MLYTGTITIKTEARTEEMARQLLSLHVHELAAGFTDLIAEVIVITEDYPDKMTDQIGRMLPFDEILEMAKNNILASDMGDALVDAYLATQSNAELLKWATDENGEFEGE